VGGRRGEERVTGMNMIKVYENSIMRRMKK
jgi:hypothetical protein